MKRKYNLASVKQLAKLRGGKFLSKPYKIVVKNKYKWGWGWKIEKKFTPLTSAEKRAALDAIELESIDPVVKEKFISENLINY